jgi:hypothetical protein
MEKGSREGQLKQCSTCVTRKNALLQSLWCSSLYMRVCACVLVFERDKRDCEVEEEEALQGCSANNWYQSLKIRGGGGGGRLHARWRPRRKKEGACSVMLLSAGCSAMLLGGDIGVMLPQEKGGVMPL